MTVSAGAVDAPAAGLELTEPGVYDITAEAYHADPVKGGSLSSTGARKLLPPSCPARFRYEQQHPPAPRQAWDVGTAAHTLVLGAGPELFRVTFDDLRTKAARQEVADARARGAVPLRPAEYDQVHEMAEVLRAHPVAAKLLRRGRGMPEQTLIWRDQPTGVMRRARLDWLPAAGPGRLIIPDYKTCRSADLESVPRAMHDYGYHQQAAWYLSGVKALGLAEQPAFVFIFQEKTPPYVVTVVEPDAMALRIGRHRNRQALELYAACRTSGHWPGYSEQIELLSVPPWVESRFLDELEQHA
jgi:hypothetical protein